MKTNVKPIPFAGSQLDHTRHVCAFFNSEEEGCRVLLSFIKDGFESGDKAVHVVNPFFVPPEEFLPEVRQRRTEEP
jgi:hypothetical protein